MYSTMEKKSLVSKKIAIARINAIHACRIDLSKPAPVRVETCRRASGDTPVKYM
jgi:hypothetical protein